MPALAAEPDQARRRVRLRKLLASRERLLLEVGRMVRLGRLLRSRLREPLVDPFPSTAATSAASAPPAPVAPLSGLPCLAGLAGLPGLPGLPLQHALLPGATPDSATPGNARIASR